MAMIGRANREVWARTFHPRNALEDMSDGAYGVIDKHYIPTGSQAMTPLALQTVEEPSVITSSRVSIELGLSKVRQVSLSETEKAKISTKAAMVELSSRKKLENLYQQWQAQWTSPKMMAAGNPLTFADCKEYIAFAEECKKLGKKAWPFLISKYSAGNRHVMAALEELVYPAVKDLMEMVHDENRATMYDENGVYTISTLEGNWLQFCKKVIEYKL